MVEKTPGMNHPSMKKESNQNMLGASVTGNLMTLNTGKAGGKNSTTRSTHITGQKFRKLPGGVETIQVENMPSDISDDEWGEIQKFGQKLHEEQQRKLKADHNNRVRQVRDVLD